MQQHADHLPSTTDIREQPTSAQNHPLASVIVDTPKERGNRLGEAQDFGNPLGKGIGALVDDRKLATGSHRFMAGADLELSAPTADAQRLGGQGARMVLIAIDGKAGEPLTIADRINVAAPAAVQAGGRRSSASRS